MLLVPYMWGFRLSFTDCTIKNNIAYIDFIVAFRVLSVSVPVLLLRRPPEVYFSIIPSNTHINDNYMFIWNV